MARRTITKWWIFGAVTLASAATLIIADGVALADHLAAVPVGRGQGLTPDGFSRNVMVLMILGASVAAIGIAFELVAWFGALASTHGLADRRWFTALATDNSPTTGHAVTARHPNTPERRLR